MDGFLGEIRMFGGNYAPEGWRVCDGALLTINGNEALYSLIGVTYGGDNKTTFGLPDLRGRLPVGQGTGAGLTPRAIGQKGGSSSVQVTTAQMPAHAHALSASTTDATTATIAANEELAKPKTLATGQVAAYAPAALVTPSTVVEMAPTAISTASGGGQAHNNVMPYLAINYLICIQGIYPSRP